MIRHETIISYCNVIHNGREAAVGSEARVVTS